MPLTFLCTFSGHKADAAVIENAGRSFSRCGRCRSDLVQIEGRWTAAPKGFRIVWRPAGEKPLKALPAPEAIEPLPAMDSVQASEPSPESAEPVRTSDVLELATELAKAPDPLDFDMTIAEAPAFDSTPASAATPAEEPVEMPRAIFRERRGVDRRSPDGARAPYTGFERRQTDRRSFGRKRGEA